MSDPVKYSAEWVQQQAREKRAGWLDHHTCGGCDVMVGYSIRGDSVHFHSACGCSSWGSDPRPSSFEEIADWLDMQRDDETRDRIMQGLG